ncbi:MAG: M28 family peptidase [Anaerolineae bacterium]|nr:M28 family peptidase [Anaerolineae bacterium]
MSQNRQIAPILMVLALIAGTLLPASTVAREPEPVALVQIRWQEPADLERIQATGVVVYARLSDDRGVYLLAGATPDALQALRRQQSSIRVLDHDMPGDGYYFVYPMPGRPVPAWDRYGRVALDDGSRLLLEAAPDAAWRLAGEGMHVQALSLQPKPLRSAAREDTVPSIVAPDPRVQAMIDEINAATLSQTVGDLSGEWPAQVAGEPYTITTRYTYSGTPVEKATRYIGERLAGLGLDVEYHTWQAGRPPNVIGELPGESDSDEILMITGHLDSITYQTPMTLAPGADDNASGAVAVLVAANLLSRYPWRCTLRFATWTGEEQGLLGSEAYALRSYDAGEKIQGVLNLDMIAWNSPGSARDIDLHADQYGVPASMALAQLFADVVDVYDLDLIPEIVPNGTGASDHASFWDYGYTAILGIEDFDDFNPYYHQNGDTLDHLDLSYFVDFVKASVATLAHMGCLAEGGIAGTVTEATTGAPIAATVTMTDTTGLVHKEVTGADGSYLHLVVPGTYTVTGTAPAYTPTRVSGVVVTSTIVTQDLALQPFHRMQVEPGMLAATLDPGEQIGDTLWLTNPSATAVDWGVYELPFAARGDVTWLDIAPASGSLAAGQATSLTVTFDAGETPAGLYMATLVFTVHRPAWAETRVPVILSVGGERTHYYLPLVTRGE